MKKSKQPSAFMKPLERNSVVTVVLERIKDAIINKELKAGDYLPSETELANSLGVGKSSVREAIRSLATMGIVTVRQGAGTIINREPSTNIINPLVYQLLLFEGSNEQLLELRNIIEPAAAVLAMKKATAKEDEELACIVERQRALWASGKPLVELVAIDLEFHRLLLSFTKNPYIELIGNTVLQFFEPSIELTTSSIPDIALQNHEDILEAFIARDEDKLRKVLLNSYETWKQSLTLINKVHKE